MKIIRFISVVVIIFVKVVHNSSQSTHSYQQSEKKIPRTLATTANLKVRNKTWKLIQINSSEIIRNKQQN